MEPIERHHQDPEPDDVTLDALLAQARWPEPNAYSKQRLQLSWRQAWNPRPARWTRLAFAAAVVLTACITLRLSLRNATQEPQRHRVAFVAFAPLPRPSLIQVSEPRLYQADSREPTARERLAMCELSPRKRSRTRTSPPTQTLSSSDSGVHPSLDPAASIESRVPQPQPPPSQRPSGADDRIESLLAELSSPHVAMRYAAARELARVDGPATTALLIDLVERNVHRREALAALLLCAASNDVQASQYLADARAWRGMGGQIRSAELQLNTF